MQRHFHKSIAILLAILVGSLTQFLLMLLLRLTWEFAFSSAFVVGLATGYSLFRENVHETKSRRLIRKTSYYSVLASSASVLWFAYLLAAYGLIEFGVLAIVVAAVSGAISGIVTASTFLLTMRFLESRASPLA